MKVQLIDTPAPAAHLVEGINRENRALLERLHRDLPGAFDADTPRRRSASTSTAPEGFLRVSLDTRRPGEWVEDAWVVADRVFSPCYIGGWSACQYWGMTDQVFRTVLVVSGKRVRSREQVIQGTPYRITVRSVDKLFGTTLVWRGQVRVQVSDPTRTIVDVLDAPVLGGGMRSVADVVHEYLTGEHRDDELLVAYADRLGNRAVFKRLGFVLEHLGLEAPGLVAACLARRSTGLVALDPSVNAKGRIVRRWGIRANVSLGRPGGDW